MNEKKKKQVFCKDCKWLVIEYFGDGGEHKYSHIPKHVRCKPRPFFDPVNGEILPEGWRRPRECNANCDCSLYEPKEKKK